ncbi:MAG: tRNA (adenosine(37)-N6)-threonylcarbamoyltransferase complex ATPase subunit type 1 TsaE [bacterium]|nr:tRNA (adenosine(37)-N6)-threonylcarbamoyltransferase complex ATPase subunit type 1 TsaE [bacterium]
MEKVLTSHSEAETMQIAAAVAQTLRGGDVLLLDGELGAGKSVFVRGLARALGITDRITSPTFVLFRVYQVKYKEQGTRNGGLDQEGPVSHVRMLVHVDAYRVRDAQELLDAGLGEWLERDDTVVAIEWGERVRDAIPVTGRARAVTFSGGDSTDERIVTVCGAAE